jgi:hypothetical protein
MRSQVLDTMTRLSTGLMRFTAGTWGTCWLSHNQGCLICQSGPFFLCIQMSDRWQETCCRQFEYLRTRQDTQNEICVDSSTKGSPRLQLATPSKFCIWILTTLLWRLPRWFDNPLLPLPVATGWFDIPFLPLPVAPEWFDIALHPLAVAVARALKTYLLIRYP